MADLPKLPVSGTWTGPLEYNEVVYALHSFLIAEGIMQDVRDGKAVDPEVVAWASRFGFLPHVRADITGASLPDADSY